MQYRRTFIKGGCYFFTVNLLERNKTLLTDHIDLLRGSFRMVKRSHPFEINAFVVLPDHLHTVWTLPENDTDYPKRWRLIKSHFSRHLPKTEHIKASRQHKGERAIWQRRFWEHVIRDELDYQRHIDYIHYNPVKHSYVDKAVDWPYSSIHKFVREGLLPPYWGVAEPFDESLYGE